MIMERVSKILRHLSVRHLNAMNQAQRKYAVFVCGPYLDNPIGDYGDMIIQLLQTENDGIKFTKFNVYSDTNNELPSFDDIVNNNYNGIIFSGSRYDAHSNDEWTVNLRKFIRTIYDYNINLSNDEQEKLIKMVGICFGHQAIAHALNNGKSDRNDKKIWELGIKKLKLTNSFYQLFDNQKDIKSINILQTHRDAVLSLPDNAQLLAYSDGTDIEMFHIGKQIFCMQGHPEFDKYYQNAILVYKREHDDNIEPYKDEFEAAAKSLIDSDPNNDLLKRLILDFLNM